MSAKVEGIMKKRIFVRWRLASMIAAAFFLLPPSLSAQTAQIQPPEKPRIVDMISFRISAPPGGKWDVEILEEGVRVVFSRSKGGGLLSALSPASQQRETVVVVSSVGLRPDRWLLTESEIVDVIAGDYVEALGSREDGSFKLEEKGEAEQKGKKLRFAKFGGHVRASNDPGQHFDQDQLVYFYFPPDFKKTHRYFQFESVFSRAVSGMKLYKNPGAEPVLAVVDSLEIVSALQPGPGPDGDVIRAAEAGDLEAVRQALDKGGGPDASSGRATALGVAAFFGRREIAELLLEKGADIDKGDNENDAPALFQAVFGLEPEMAAFLVERGADVNRKTRPGMSPLMLASTSKQAGIAAMLLERGADVAARDEEGRTPLMYAATSGSQEIVGFLLDRGALADEISKGGATALMAAAEEGHEDIVGMLLERGADAKFRNDFGWTALWSAVDNGRAEIVRLLLEKGAEVDVPLTGELGVNNPTPLHLAIYRFKPEIARMLVEAGADVDAKNATGLTPLMRAAWTEQADIVKFLVEKKADVNARGEKNRTALWYAKKVNNKEIARMLQAAGAK
jgi:ankyrin repeat protein